MEKKQTVLVTGASRGIGAAIAECFAMDGHRVAIGYHQNGDAAERLRARLQAAGCAVMCVGADIADEKQAADMADAVHARFGTIGVLVNNAGVALPQQLLTDCLQAEWTRLFDINVRGMFLVTKAVLPDMIGKKAGSIVNISSMWGSIGGSCEVPYSASKAAVVGFTKSLAKEVAPSNVRVNCVSPGFVPTDMNAALSERDMAAIVEETPLLRAGAPVDIARAVRFLASEDASFITGQVLHVDGGRCI